MNAKFWKGNKDLFLRYFEDCGQWSASQVYDAMIKAGNFEVMNQIVQEKTSFKCEEFFKQIKGE